MGINSDCELRKKGMDSEKGMVDWNEFSIHKTKDIDERIIMVTSSRLAYERHAEGRFSSCYNDTK